MKKSVFQILSIIMILSLLITACGSKEEIIPEESITSIEETSKQEETSQITETTEIAPTETEMKTLELDSDLQSKFRGTPIEEEINHQRPIAVMIDNHPDARMQAGFRQADMVFEMIVEGTFTRYMMLFHSQDAERVGPIRSARKYYIDRMQEFDAIYTHYGASAEGDDILRARGIDDIDGMVVPSSVIYRYNDTGKFAPHNAYSGTEVIREYAEKRGSMMTTENPGFSFHPEQTPLNGEVAKEVTVSYFADNNSIFTYHEDSETYTYNKDGVEIVDENDQKELAISNIIIQVANYYPNPSYKGILSLDQVGEGEGYYFSNGEYLPLTWSKADENSQTEYFVNGEKIMLNPGQTWVLIASPQTGIEMK